jgi:hypothetical protein
MKSHISQFKRQAGIAPDGGPKNVEDIMVIDRLDRWVFDYSTQSIASL